MPENFTDGGFEDCLQQFNTAASISGWFSTAQENRPHYFAPRLRGSALHFCTTLSAAQQVDFNVLIDAFQQNYTTNVDILKTGLKATGQQPKQDIFAFLCEIRTLARRDCRRFLYLVEQSVLTNFVERLNGSTLRWELRKWNHPRADNSLSLASKLNFFQEIEKRTQPTSKMAQTSVNVISCDARELSIKECMEDFVRILTEGFKKTKPTQSPEVFQTQNSTPNGNQVTRPNTTDSQGNRTVRFWKKTSRRSIDNGRDSNWRGSTRQNSTPYRPNNKNNSSKGQCTLCKRENHNLNECIACYLF